MGRMKSMKAMKSQRPILSKNKSVGQAKMEIKYSMELKKGEGRGAVVREMQFNEEVSVEGRVKKKLIIDYIQEEIGKINPDKQIFKRTNASLNRLIAHKILEKQKAAHRNSHLDHPPTTTVEDNLEKQSRKRMTTLPCQAETEEGSDSLSLEKEELLRGLELRKAEMVRKRLLGNKAIEMVRRGEKTKVKLPEVKISLIVENARPQQATD